ncbi:hypothetical protein J3B02_000816 [Coemansia erecta]|nr:hypothetical protein J3B02_000816 [Coemansia erecta]
MECLVSARSIGILYRDISLGNIAVRSGTATVIDWGYAKIIDYGINDASEFAAHWKFDSNDIKYNFNIALTEPGFMRYMDYQSAQQFMNRKTIKIFDRAESSKDDAIVSKKE